MWIFINKRKVMKILEGDFDSYANMGSMGTNQEKNTNEQEGYDEDKGRAYREIGALSVIVANAIMGRLGENPLDYVLSSTSLSDATKQSIKDMVEEAHKKDFPNDVENPQEEIGDVQIGGGDTNNGLRESAKQKLMTQFKRFLLL